MQNAETRVKEIGAVDLQSETFTFNRDNIDRLIDAQVDGQQPQSPDTTVQCNDIMWSNEDICRQLDEELHQQLSEELQVASDKEIHGGEGQSDNEFHGPSDKELHSPSDEETHGGEEQLDEDEEHMGVRSN